MAECYHCGAWIDKGQGYRRSVHTGSFDRTTLGSRSTSISTGNRHSLRTLCEACATANDIAVKERHAKNQRDMLIIAVVIAVFLLFLFAGKH